MLKVIERILVKTPCTYFLRPHSSGTGSSPGRCEKIPRVMLNKKAKKHRRNAVIDRDVMCSGSGTVSPGRSDLAHHCTAGHPKTLAAHVMIAA